MNWHQLLSALAAGTEAAALSTTGTVSSVLHVVAFVMAYIVRTSQVNDKLGEIAAKIPGKAVDVAGIMLLAVALTFGNCAHVTPVVVDCAQEVSASVLPAVESALVGDNYVTELTKLVAQFGECVIRRAVVLITGEARHDMQAAPTDTNARRKYEHGQNWLAAHPGT
jgi:hypothetical protein